MRAFVILFLLFFTNNIVAQNKCTLHFNHLMSNENVVLDKTYFVKNDTLLIQTLKYYISKIQFLQKGKIVWKEKNSFHLINEEDINSKQITFKNFPKNIQCDAIQFCVGIDSTTNYDGVKGGDLDPTKGMYWTWQNGYINFKLEGKSAACKTRNNQFQFHIGGYQFPYASMQTITLLCSKNEIFIDVHIDQLLQQIDIATQNEIVQPSKEAVLIAQKLAPIFSIK